MAEEGLDVAEANCVIRFDEVLNAVSFVQARGRGRQEGASHLVMRERADRPVAKLETIEVEQRRVVENFARNNLANDPAAKAKEEEVASQMTLMSKQAPSSPSGTARDVECLGTLFHA